MGRRGCDVIRALALLPFLLAACVTTPSQEFVARNVVQYAVITVINGDVSRAETVFAIAASAISFASEQTTDLPSLEAHVREAIPWQSLDTADRRLVEVLLLAVRDELEARLGDGAGQIPPARVGAAVEVLEWVCEAAEIAGRVETW